MTQGGPPQGLVLRSSQHSNLTLLQSTPIYVDRVSGVTTLLLCLSNKVYTQLLNNGCPYTSEGPDSYKSTSTTLNHNSCLHARVTGPCKTVALHCRNSRLVEFWTIWRADV